MKQNNVFETILSAIVIAVAAGFLFFASTVTGGARLSDYQFSALMSNASGLVPGASDVRVSGLKVGTVSGLTMDPKSYLARVTIRIHHDIQIPKDSTFSVSSDTLSPSSYIQIAPGRSVEMVPPDGELPKAQ